MNWLDVLLICILGASVVTSFRKGLTRELVGLASIVLALVLGLWFYGTAGAWLRPFVSSNKAANFAGFFLVFCGVAIVGASVSWALGKFLKVTGLSIFDQALGAGFGLVRGLLIAVALILGIIAFAPDEHPPAAVTYSRMAPYVLDASRVFVALAPHDLKEGFQRTYAQLKTVWKKTLEKGIHAAPDVEKKPNERQI